MAAQLPPDVLAARLRLVDEHVKAEIDQDIEAIMRTWGPEPWFDDVAWEERSQGRDEVRRHYAELLDAMPDFMIEEHARHVTEDFVILEVTISGTQRRRWRDLPATNRRIESRVCVLYAFDETGLLRFERTYYDRAVILEQLGLFHDPRKPFGKVMAVVTPPYTVIGAFLRNLFRRG